MAAAVTTAIRLASRGLLEGDLAAVSQTFDVAAQVKQARVDADEVVHELLVRQQPVASDLRLALASLHVSGDLERMAVLSEHIIKIMLLRHPARVLPDEAADVVMRMAEVAERLAWKVTGVLETRDPDRAGQLERDDDEMDRLHQDLFTVLFGDWPHGVKAAVDAALLGRFYERYADHAVNAGRQVVYLVTGRPPA